MAVKEAVLRIFVKDAGGMLKTPGPNDKVKVNGIDLGYSVKDGFAYKLGTLKTELSIEYSGYASLRQWFESDAPAERPKLTPFWPGSDKDPETPKAQRNGYLLACMKALPTTSTATSQTTFLSAWPRMKDAFSPATSTINIWGCFAASMYHELVYFLNHSKPHHKFRDTWTDPAVPKDLSRAEAVQVLQDAMNAGCYMKFIARHTGCKTWGGPPGYGSEWKDYSKLLAVSPSLRSSIKGQTLTVPATLGKTAVRKLYESPELGTRKFNEFGYMLYLP